MSILAIVSSGVFMSTNRRQELRDADWKKEGPLFFQQSVDASNLISKAFESMFPRIPEEKHHYLSQGTLETHSQSQRHMRSSKFSCLINYIWFNKLFIQQLPSIWAWPFKIKAMIKCLHKDIWTILLEIHFIFWRSLLEWYCRIKTTPPPLENELFFKRVIRTWTHVS